MPIALAVLFPGLVIPQAQGGEADKIRLATKQQSAPEPVPAKTASTTEVLGAMDAFGCTALHRAAHADAIADARALLEARADPDARDAWDETPLHIAARSGSTEICSLLLQNGAEPNSISAQDWTPLLNAAHAGKAATCELLLEHGGHTGGVADSDLPTMLTGLLAARVLGGGSASSTQDVEGAADRWVRAVQRRIPSSPSVSDQSEAADAVVEPEETLADADVESWWRPATPSKEDADVELLETEVEEVNVEHWRCVGAGILNAFNDVKAEVEEDLLREEQMEQRKGLEGATTAVKPCAVFQ
jgi:ankyrin repeat protein